jgi:anti-sigma B factor antagonist
MSATSQPAFRPPVATRVTRSVVGRRAVLSVAGEVDLSSASLLREAVGEALGAGALELWIDLSRTEFIDSAGLHVLLEAHVRTRDLRRRFAVVCPPGWVRRALDVAKLGERLPLCDSRAVAHRVS